MKRPVDAVIEFLQSEMNRGVSHVLLDEGARDGLRELYIRAHPKTRAAQQTRSISVNTTQAPQSRVSNQLSAAQTTKTQFHQLRVVGNTRIERLASIRQQAEGWTPANTLGTLRPTLVFSDGNPEASLMLIGEAPGYEEERQRMPFVGSAGLKLNDILKAMGLLRDQVYVSNVVKFRPSAPRQITNTRKPSSEEIQACLPLVLAEIQEIRPKCIVALGSTAAEGLLGLSGDFSAMRNSWHHLQNIPVRVTHHPSILLQSDANKTFRRQVWEDMLAVMEILNIPISDKQRNFFTKKTTS